MEIYTVGIDIGKAVFNLVGLERGGWNCWRARSSRAISSLHFTANLRVGLIGMEACGGSHFLARALREQGHEVRLMPAQYVKPYVKTDKNDYTSMQRRSLPRRCDVRGCGFVPIKERRAARSAVAASGARRLGGAPYSSNQPASWIADAGAKASRYARDDVISKMLYPEFWKTRTVSCQQHCCMLLLQAYSEMRQLQSQIDEADAVIRRIAGEDESLPAAG